MLKHARLVTVGVAGLASSMAMGAVNTSIVWQVSADGQSWGGGIFSTAGATVYARAVVSYTGTGAPLGLASLVFQPTVSNWSAVHTLAPFVNDGMGGNTSSPVGVVTDPNSTSSFGRLAPWGRTALSATSFMRGHAHFAGSGGAPAGNWLRIAQNQVTSWVGGAGNTTGGQGVPISQLNDVGRTPQDPAYNSSLQNIVVFKFAIQIGNSGAATLGIDAPIDGFGNRNATTGEREVYWYGSMSETTGSIRGTASVVTAWIFIPSPSAGVGLLLGAGVLGSRRVRR